MSHLFISALTDGEMKAWEIGTRLEQEVLVSEVVERQYVELKRLRAERDAAPKLLEACKAALRVIALVDMHPDAPVTDITARSNIWSAKNRLEDAIALATTHETADTTEA